MHFKRTVPCLVLRFTEGLRVIRRALESRGGEGVWEVRVKSIRRAQSLPAQSWQTAVIFHHKGRGGTTNAPWSTDLEFPRAVLGAAGFNPFELNNLCAVLKTEAGSTAVASVSLKLTPWMRGK